MMKIAHSIKCFNKQLLKKDRSRMISYSVPNHVTPVFIILFPSTIFYFSLLYRQVRISHQTLIHRMCDLTSLTDCPHDKRLSSVHITCCKYIFHTGRICPLCRRHVRPCIQLDAKRICNIFFLFQGILLRLEPDLHPVSSRNPALLTLPCVRFFHPFAL